MLLPIPPNTTSPLVWCLILGDFFGILGFAFASKGCLVQCIRAKRQARCVLGRAVLLAGGCLKAASIESAVAILAYLASMVQFPACFSWYRALLPSRVMSWCEVMTSSAPRRQPVLLFVLQPGRRESGTCRSSELLAAKLRLWLLVLVRQVHARATRLAWQERRIPAFSRDLKGKGCRNGRVSP